jgi:signal transduction histidine kinase
MGRRMHPRPEIPRVPALLAAAAVAAACAVWAGLPGALPVLLVTALAAALHAAAAERRGGRDAAARRATRARLRDERRTAGELADGLRRSRVDAEGRARRLRAVLAERAIAEVRREAVVRVGQRLSADASPPAIAEALLRGAEDLAGATAGAVYGLDAWGAPLRLLAASGVDRPPPAEMTLVVDGDGPFVAPDRAGEPLHRCGAPALLLPLRRGDFLVGALWVAGHDLCPDQARRDELLHLAAQAAVALDTARAVHAAMREAETVRAVVEADPDGIHLVDPSGRTLLANRPFRALAEEAVADPEGLPGASVAAADAHAARAAEGGVVAGDETYTLAGTGRAVVRHTAPVRDVRGGQVGWVFIHRDVTAERDAERVKDEFLALVSHELRTPLTSVLGYTEVLLEGELGELSDAQTRAVTVVERNAHRLQRLVGDLLVVAQAQAGRLSLITDRLDLAVLAEERVAAFAPLAADAGVLLVHLAADGPAPADGDRERLGQVLDNLISNALAHTPHGGVVTVRVTAGPGAHEVRVADTGPGIPAEDRERVFASFWRGGAGATGGVGLGLAISRAIARAHGGDLRVADDGPGAVMALTVPAAPAPVPAPLAGAA